MTDNYSVAIPVKASTKLYEGAAVGLTSGYVDNADATAGFIGFIKEDADNSTGSAGDIDAVVSTKGEVTLSVTSVAAVTDVGSTVYAVDSATFTLASTGNIAIGKIVRWISSTNCVVAYEGTQVRSI